MPDGGRFPGLRAAEGRENSADGSVADDGFHPIAAAAIHVTGIRIAYVSAAQAAVVHEKQREVTDGVGFGLVHDASAHFGGRDQSGARQDGEMHRHRACGCADSRSQCPC